jgi:hypothetical protein
MMREMDASKTVGVREVWAPNRYLFTLSESDGQRFEQAEQALVTELKQVVREAAAERGWGLVGPPDVEFQVDAELGKVASSARPPSSRARRSSRRSPR